MGVTVVIFLQDNEEVGLWVNLDFAGGVPQRHDGVSKLFTESFNWNDSQGVTWNGYNTFMTLLWAKGASLLQVLVAQWSYIHSSC